MTTGMERVREIAQAVDHVLVDELKLQPPMKFQVVKDGNFILMLAVMDVRNLRGSIHKYANDHVVHQLSTAVGGLPVVLSNHSGLRFAISLAGKPKLAQIVKFPVGDVNGDDIPLAVSLRGKVDLHPAKIKNMLIGGSQESGKSMALRLIAHVARMQGAELYLADPDQHTFNPDLWDRFAKQPVAGSSKELIRLLELMQAEVEARSALFRAVADGGIPPEDVDAYNATLTPTLSLEGRGGLLPRIYFIADEMNTHLSDRGVQDRVAELARVGRKWGVHLFIAAHNWRSEDIPRGLSAMFPTRLCLRVADNTSGSVTLNSTTWGKQAMSLKNPGRAILFANGKFEKVQTYYVPPEMEREWLSAGEGGEAAVVSPLPEEEAELVNRSLDKEGGRFTQGLLQLWGLGPREARSLLERYEARGWVEQDPKRSNGRYITEKLAVLATNRQTRQTTSNPQIGGQTPDKPRQTPDMAVA